MEVELHQRHALDVLRFDVMDAVDVEEVVLVVVGDQAFHLTGVHAAVGLSDIDDGEIEQGEDIDFHPTKGQSAACDESDHRHHDGNGAAQCELNGVHSVGSLRWSATLSSVPAIIKIPRTSGMAAGIYNDEVNSPISHGLPVWRSAVTDSGRRCCPFFAATAALDRLLVAGGSNQQRFPQAGR